MTWPFEVTLGCERLRVVVLTLNGARHLLSPSASMHRSSLLLLSILVFASTSYAQGDPIVSVTGGDDAGIVIFSGQAFAVSWSQENLTLETAISARLSSNGRAGEEGIAFLSNALGLGTSMDALVA